MQSTNDTFDKLDTLYQLREKRALEEIVVQRIELARVQAALDEQLALVASLRNELDTLHVMRTTRNITQMSSQSLIAESDRRRWLTFDLEKETFYLDTFRSDVLAAEKELEKRRHDWLRLRNRMQAVDTLSQKHVTKDQQTVSRRDDARLDDRPIVQQA